MRGGINETISVNGGVSEMEKKVFILDEHIDDEYETDFEIDGYTHLRAFHACRPLKIEDYLKNGIRAISYKSALQDVKDRVVCDKVSETEAIAKFQEEWSNLADIHKRVWLQMNKKVLLNEACHYLIYGSEFINALAMKLFCRNRLKKIGIPTIFYCDIPLDDIVPMTLNDIQNCVNENIYDISFAVENVKPNSIVNFEHPTKRMNDPYGGSYKPDYELLKKYGYVSDKCAIEESKDK